MDAIDQILYEQKNQNLTFEELAEKIGTSPQIIYDWRKRKKAPRYEMLLKTAEALGCEIVLVRKADGSRPGREE